MQVWDYVYLGGEQPTRVCRDCLLEFPTIYASLLSCTQVWDYVYLGGEQPVASPIPADLLQRMRREFEYWYPFDLRVSGKDLIQVGARSLFPSRIFLARSQELIIL